MADPIAACKLLEEQLGDLGADGVEVELSSARAHYETTPSASTELALTASIVMARAILQQLRDFSERPEVEAGDVLYRGRYYSPQATGRAIALLERAKHAATEQRSKLLMPLVLETIRGAAEQGGQSACHSA